MALLLAAPLAAAPAPKGKPSYFYPTTVGAKREYERTSGDEVSEDSNVVTRVETKDGRVVVTVERKPGANEPPVKAELSETGLIEQLVLKTPTPRMTILKLPATLGETWTHDPGDPMAWKTQYTVISVAAEVEVPAGKFSAVQVNTIQTMGLQAITTSYWYAKGIGLVKCIREERGKVEVYALKSFELDKK